MLFKRLGPTALAAVAAVAMAFPVTALATTSGEELPPAPMTDQQISQALQTGVEGMPSVEQSLDAQADQIVQGLVPQSATQAGESAEDVQDADSSDTDEAEEQRVYKVESVDGDTRFTTAVEVANQAYPQGVASQTAILAYGFGWADSLSAAALAGAIDCPILFTDTQSVPNETAECMLQLGVTNAIVVGGSAVVDPTVEQTLQTMGIETSRIAGADRYATNLAIYEYGVERDLWKHGSAIVASGGEFTDALSMSPASFATKTPIILCQPGKTLSKAQRTALVQNGVSTYSIAGGEAAVAKAAETNLKTVAADAAEAAAAAKDSGADDEAGNASAAGETSGDDPAGSGSNDNAATTGSGENAQGGDSGENAAGTGSGDNDTQGTSSNDDDAENAGSGGNAAVASSGDDGDSAQATGGNAASTGSDADAQVTGDANNGSNAVADDDSASNADSSSTINVQSADAATGRVERIAGQNRYATSTAVAEWAVKKGYLSTWDGTAFATGTAAADALSGSVLQGISKAPLLLIDNEAQSALEALAAHKPASVRVLGGKSAVAPILRNDIAKSLGFRFNDIEGFKVYLDAGHGWNNKGNDFYDSNYYEGTGYAESELNKELANMVEQRLTDAGVDVFCNDDGGPYWLRHPEAVLLGCNVIVSIHFNAAGDGGSLALIHDTNACKYSREVANIIYPYLAKAIGLQEQGIYEQTVAILGGPLPATLLEVCYYDREDDMEVYQKRKTQVADGIAQGIQAL